MSARWRPALRMARRDLTRHKVRALLTCLLVALPAVVATVAALAAHNSRWTPEVSATETMGAADAQLLVTPYAAVAGGRRSLWLEPRPVTPDGRRGAGGGERSPERRDPASVDLAGLLPAGSELVRTGPLTSRPVLLATGGSAEVRFLEVGSPVVAPLARVTAGAAPSGPHQVAVPSYVGEELGLLESSGEPRRGARLELADGTALDVAGVYDTGTSLEDLGPVLVASPDSRLLRGDRGRELGYLVGLPELSRPELKALATELNAAGIAFRPRDAVLHPQAWGLPDDDGGSIDITPLVVATFCILVGMLEVVLLVGAAFAVSARRQVRDLGLLAANGGSGADVRRVLLAQGVVLGVLSSVMGTAAGVALFLGAHEQLESAFGGYVPWRTAVDWRAVVLVAVLGSTTSVVAALVPGWSLGRLTPVAALSGRFPLRAGESRAHRGAAVLACAGLVLLLLGGWATSRTFRPGGGEVPLAPAAAALGLLVLVVGVVWATPMLVREAARTGAHLPLAGRYAFRDAGRHRFRSASAVVALAITVAGAVMASFLVAAATRVDGGQAAAPQHSLQVEPPARRALAPEQLTAIRGSLEQVVGDVELLTASQLGPADRPRSSLVTPGRRPVRATDRATLAELLGPGQEDVLAAFDRGAVVRLDPRTPPAADTEVTLRLDGPRRGEKRSWTVPVVDATVSGVRQGAGDSFAGALLSHQAADGLGLEQRWTQVVALADRPITEQDLDRLRVHGLYAWSADPDVASARRLQYVGLAVAGLVTALVVGVAVALAAAESRDDTATLAAVGAGPNRRRAMGAMHGLFLGLVGAAVGGSLGVVAGVSLGQVDGLPGVAVPWSATAATLVVVLLLAPVAGWLVTPSRLDLSRRAA